jgi:photosystem II stability/assembly factor-like uncharacterized protein
VGFVVGLIALTGCSSAAGPAGTSTRGTPPPVSTTSSRPSPLATRVLPGGPGIVDTADLVSGGFGLVGTGPNPQTGGPTRLVATFDDGRSFVDIGPRVPNGWQPDDIYFRDRLHGWFLVFDPLSLAERLYRTDDGGHSWRWYPAPSHNLAGGSTDIVQFTTPTDGWLVDIIANAPGETLYRTRDAGATWQRVAALFHTPDPLPKPGLVSFEAGDAVGWLAGGRAPYPGPLYLTRTQGRTWQLSTLARLPGAVFGVPTIFGPTLVEPVTVTPNPAGCTTRTDLRLYTSPDGGARWQLASQLVDAADTPYSCGPSEISTSFPTPTTGWASTTKVGQIVVYRTTDQGAHWTTTVITRAPAAYPTTIEAIDANEAWLITAAPPGVNGNNVYATVDGGRTWHQIDHQALHPTH